MLEYSVRPFQSPGAHGRGVIASTPHGTRDRATLTWGGKGDALPPVKSRGGTSVECRATRGTQSGLPAEPTLTKEMTSPYAQRDLADDDYPWQVAVKRNSQTWLRIDPVAETDPGTTPLIYRRTESMVLDDKKTDECAGDWDQLSGVASAVTAAFADLAADIHAGGAGVSNKKCRTTVTWAQNAAPFFWGGIYPDNPYPDG